MSDDPRQLLLRMRRGDDAAARSAWACFAPAMIGHAAAIVGRDEAEDVVQAVFVNLLRQPRRTLARVADAPAWLASLTRRTAINHLRAACRERARRQRRDQPAPAPKPPVDGLQHAVDSLPRRLREVIALKHAAGLTFDQIALALGVNRNTAASRHRAALGVLRRLLATRPQPPEVVHAR